MADAAKKGRKKWPEDRLVKECKRGHRMDGENLYVSPSGERRCRACNRERVAKHLRKKRAELRARGRTTRDTPMSWGWRLRLGQMGAPLDEEGNPA